MRRPPEQALTTRRTKNPATQSPVQSPSRARPTRRTGVVLDTSVMLSDPAAFHRFERTRSAAARGDTEWRAGHHPNWAGSPGIRTDARRATLKHGARPAVPTNDHGGRCASISKLRDPCRRAFRNESNEPDPVRGAHTSSPRPLCPRVSKPAAGVKAASFALPPQYRHGRPRSTWSRYGLCRRLRCRSPSYAGVRGRTPHGRPSLPHRSSSSATLARRGPHAAEILRLVRATVRCRAARPIRLAADRTGPPARRADRIVRSRACAPAIRPRAVPARGLSWSAASHAVSCPPQYASAEISASCRPSPRCRRGAGRLERSDCGTKLPEEIFARPCSMSCADPIRGRSLHDAFRDRRQARPRARRAADRAVAHARARGVADHDVAHRDNLRLVARRVRVIGR